MGFIFGTGAIAPRSASYQAWAKGRLADNLLADSERCKADGEGGYIFVTAEKPA
jgi:hypothetical protein